MKQKKETIKKLMSSGMTKEKANNIAIQKELRKHGMTGGKIAKELGIDRANVYGAIRGGGGSRKIRVHIAQIIGLPPSILWEGIYQGSMMLLDDYEYMREKVRKEIIEESITPIKTQTTQREARL